MHFNKVKNSIQIINTSKKSIYVVSFFEMHNIEKIEKKAKLKLIYDEKLKYLKIVENICSKEIRKSALKQLSVYGRLLTFACCSNKSILKNIKHLLLQFLTELAKKIYKNNF